MKENGGKMDQTHIDKAECRNNLSRFTEESLKAALILQEMCLKGDKIMNLCSGPQKASRRRVYFEMMLSKSRQTYPQGFIILSILFIK